MFHFTDGGLRNVWLTNGFVERNTPYGKATSFHDLDGLINAICLALAKKPGKLTGAEFRYIRSAMLLSQKSLGHMIGYSEQAVAKWEKFGKVPKAVDFVIRMIYVNKTSGDAKISAMVDMLNILDKISNTKIVISESNARWESVVQVVDDELVAA
jgi:putative transcriptional regulator